MTRLEPQFERFLKLRHFVSPLGGLLFFHVTVGCVAMERRELGQASRSVRKEPGEPVDAFSGRWGAALVADELEGI